MDEATAAGARGRRLAWSTAIFALATGLSRILGLVREIVVRYFFGTVGLLVNHVGRVRECQRLDAEGVPPSAAADRLKRNRFYVQKLYDQARNYSAEELGDAIVRLADLDHALKGGSRLPGELAFARAVIEITRSREAAPA